MTCKLSRTYWIHYTKPLAHMKKVNKIIPMCQWGSPHILDVLPVL